MSTQNTGFISNNKDLSKIFYPLTGISATTKTGYQYYNTTTSSYQDLINLFEPWSRGDLANLTNYMSIPNNCDLNQIFQNINYTPVMFTTTGNPTIINVTSTQYIVQFTDTTATNSITFTTIPTNCSYVVVGGGGSGGSGSDTGGTVSIAGGGGGGGQVLISTFSPSINTQYSVTLGVGGPECTTSTDYNILETTTGGQSPDYLYGNGNSSTFNNVIAAGGYSGQGTIYVVAESGNSSAYNTDRASSPIGGYNGANEISGGNGYYSNSSTNGYDAGGTVGTNGTQITIYGYDYIFGGGGGGGNDGTYYYTTIDGVTTTTYTTIDGGAGGGGTGGNSDTNPLAGTSNTGGGGGGCGVYLTSSYDTSITTDGGAGGSGTVVLYFDYN
jgi:hypothetical protein